MSAAVGGDYMCGAGRQWQYRDQPTGLLRQSVLSRTGDAPVRYLVQWLLDWPERVASHLSWLAPLFARITVGWVFLWSGWGKLNDLPTVIQNFAGWGVPLPQVLGPFVSGVEFFGGLFLLAGFLSRISAGALGITMIVAIRSAKWADVDSLETLLGFDEFEYLALFLWIAIAGPGALSVDRWLQRRFSPADPRLVAGKRA
jgi:putative oxidoreductase